MTPDLALESLLSELFTVAELRRWLHAEPERSSLDDDLAWEGAAKAQVLHDLVAALRRRGMVDPGLFLALVQARPRRSDEVVTVAVAWGLTLTEAQVKGAQAKPVDPLDSLSRAELVVALEELTIERERLSRSGRYPVDLSERIDRLVARIMDAGRPKAGDTVAGARLLKVVGNGNFGSIWLAERADGQSCAVKVFHLEKLAEGVMLWRFRRSIRAMRQLAEDRRAPPTIAQLIEVEPDTLAFSMPYLEGGNLENVAQRGWSLPVKLGVFLEVCRAVAFAHQVGIIHRDIKPANVVLDREARPVLTDFDISDIKFATKLSSTAGLGTPIFAAPEQLEQGDKADERSDVYSLGRLLHFLLLERSPGYQTEVDPSLNALSTFPAALVAVVRRACQWDPRRRYSTVAELIRDVEDSQTGWAAAKAHLRRGARWVRVNAALLSIAGLVSGGSLGGYLYQAEKARVEAGLRQELSEALKRIDALARRQDELAARGTTLATQLTGLSAEREGLAARRDALPEGDAGRAEIQAKIDALTAQIDGLEQEQARIAADQEALRAELRQARERAAKAQRGQDPGVDERAAADASARPADVQAAPSCDLRPTGGPTGEVHTVDVAEDVSMRFIGLSAGRFCMGSPDGEGYDDEHAQHPVRVSGFRMGQSEVTQAQWSAVVRAAQAAGDVDAAGLQADPSSFKGGTLPVEQVSWCDAARFANALSRLEGLSPAYGVGSDCEEGGAVARDPSATGFRLPTEAEWEYAARAGTSTRYATGDTEADLTRAGWYTANSSGSTKPVCTPAEKPWGLCDMHGNVWEWTGDWYASSYDAAEVGNPAGPPRGDFRVLRGGSWGDSPDIARSAYRDGIHPSDSGGGLGFRLVLPAPASEP